MKSQLLIICALLVSAYALPVPDEEVSPVVPAAQQIPEKTADFPQKAQENIVDAIKPTESRAAEKPAASATEKKDEKLAAELPLRAPDAELSQSLPAAAATEKKEEFKDKQTRAEDKVQDAKALPVVAAAGASSVPAGAAGVVEESQQVAESKPFIAAAVAGEEQSVIQGKSTFAADAAPAEQKKDELSAAEETPIVKSEGKPAAAEVSADAAPDAAAAASANAPAAAAAFPAATEAKKEETPARQERVGEAVNEIDGKDVPVVPAGDVVPVVKSLPSEESAVASEHHAGAETHQHVLPAKEHLKSAISESGVAKSVSAQHAPAGDISLQASEESSAKSLKSEEPAVPSADSAIPEEAKKPQEQTAAAAAPQAATAELLQQKAKEIKPEAKESEAKPLELKEKKAAEAEKLSEKKKDNDSSDSSESKESGESKEDKSA